MEHKQDNDRKKAAPERDGGCSCMDFFSQLAWEGIKGKVFPVLDEVARIEFGQIIGDSDVRAEDLREIETQAELIKECLCAYVDGLAAHFKVYGAMFFGDTSAKEVIRAELRRDSD